MYSTLFLCVKEKNKQMFSCKEFQSFVEAEKYFENNYENKNNQSAIIPVCKYIPNVLKRHVIQSKISSILNRVSIV